MFRAKIDISMPMDRKKTAPRPIVTTAPPTATGRDGGDKSAEYEQQRQCSQWKRYGLSAAQVALACDADVPVEGRTARDDHVQRPGFDRRR